MKPKTAKRLIPAAIIAAVFAVSGILRWTSVPKYEITDLGYLKGSGGARAINNKGHVVGWTQAPDPNARPTAFIWSPGKGRRSIPALEGKESRAYDINDKGQVVGYLSEITSERAPARAFIWDEKTGLTELGTLGKKSQANAVNNKGQVVGASETPDGQWHAFIWDKTNGMRDLGTLGGKSSGASDINEKGQAVGYSDLSNGQRTAFIWHQDTGMVDLGPLEGRFGGASGINNDGWVVGSKIKKNRHLAFVWNPANGMSELKKSHVLRMNDSGQIVGYHLTPKWLIFKERHSLFIWDPDHGDVELDLDLENAIFINAFYINNKGQIVVTFQKPQQSQVILLTPKGKSRPTSK